MAAFRRPATLYVCLAFINFPLLDFDLKKPEIEIPTHELGKLARGWVGGIHYWNLLPQVRRDSLAIGEPRGAYKMPTKAYDTELKWRLDLAVAQLPRSEEHTSELQSLMRISYAVFCLKKKIKPLVISAMLTTFT